MRSPILAFFLLIGIFLPACAPVSDPNAPYTPGFFYYSAPNAALFFAAKPGDSPLRTLPLAPPADCTFYAIHPAPVGRWLAVEWDCPSGPQVQVFDTASGRARFLLNDQTIDNRWLAWQPDGRSLYLKAGALSYPQTLRVDVNTGEAVELPLSGFVYDLTVSPEANKVLYSLSSGIGFGSETWLAGPDGKNPSQLLLEPQSIIALAQYSPDGRQAAFIKFPDSQEQYPAGELWVMDADGFNARKLATTDAGRGFPPVWSPGGDKIAFVGRDLPADEKSTNLSIYDLASAALITVHFSPLEAPAWSPDGAFVTFAALDNDKMTVWMYAIAARQAHSVVSGACCAGWIR